VTWALPADERHVGRRDTDRLPRSRRRSEQSRRCADRGLAALPEQPVPVPPPAVQLLPELLDRHGGRLANRAAHLKDEVEFENVVGSPRNRATSPVSFIKPVGQENEHPGYASEPNGSDHLVDLLSAIQGSSAPRTRWSS
jgi:hypothetical protein